MRVIIRVALAAALIVGDAAQAASLVAAGGGRSAEGERTSSYMDRYKRIVDQDEKTWKRVSASICAGCGAPPKPLEIARAVPLYKQVSREAQAASRQDPPAVAITQTSQKPRVQSAALQPARVKTVKTERLVRRSARLARLKSKRARYARLRLIREQKRLALIQARRAGQSLRLARRRNPLPSLKVAALDVDVQPSAAVSAGGQQPQPVPLPPRRPDALCTYDRGLVRAEGQWSVTCVSAQ